LAHPLPSALFVFGFHGTAQQLQGISTGTSHHLGCHTKGHGNGEFRSESLSSNKNCPKTQDIYSFGTCVSQQGLVFFSDDDFLQNLQCLHRKDGPQTYGEEK